MNADKITEMQAAMTEELHPILQAHVVTMDNGLRVLAHPLIHTIYPVMNGWANKQYEAKVEAVRRAQEAGDWPRYVYLHEKPYRMTTLASLIDYEHLTDPATITRILIDEWSMIENCWQVHEELATILPHLHRPTVEEDPFMQSLPDIVTVYRGHQGVNEAGYSWTTDKDKAEWFANRWQSGEGQVSQRTVVKSAILFATDDRGEKEVVIYP